MTQTQSKPELQVDVSGRRLARNTLLNLAGRVLPLLVAIATVPYVIHHLGPDRYGLLSLAGIVVGYFALFNLGIGPATTKYVAELLGRGEVEKLPELVWTAFASQTGLGVAAGVLLALASPLLVNRVLKIPADLHPQAHLIFLIMAAALPIDFASGSWSGLLGASQRFDLLNIVDVPSSVLGCLLPIAALMLGYGLAAIVLFLAVLRLVALLVQFAFCIRLYPALRTQVCFRRRLIRPLLTFGGWVALSGVLGPILLYTDRFIVGAVISIAAVGYYSVAFNTLWRLQFIPAALVGPLMPAFSSLQGMGNSEKITGFFIRAHKYLFLAITPLLLTAIVFAGNIFNIWIGGEFAVKAALPFQIIAVGMLVGLLAPVSGALTQGGGRPDLLFWIYLCEVPVNTLLTWVLAAHWGIVGAALSYSIRTIAETALLFLITVRAFGLKIRLPKGTGQLSALGALTFSVSLVPFCWVVASAPLQEKALLFVGVMAAYAHVSYRYALDRTEKELLWGFIGQRWVSIRQAGTS